MCLAGTQMERLVWRKRGVPAELRRDPGELFRPDVLAPTPSPGGGGPAARLPFLARDA